MRIVAVGMMVMVAVAFAVSAQAGGSCCAARAASSAQPAAAVEKAGKPQTTCPVMAGAIDKEQYVDYQGQRVYFCCSACKETFNANPAEYVKKLIAEGVEIEKTPEQK